MDLGNGTLVRVFPLFCFAKFLLTASLFFSCRSAYAPTLVLIAVMSSCIAAMAAMFL